MFPLRTQRQLCSNRSTNASQSLAPHPLHEEHLTRQGGSQQEACVGLRGKRKASGCPLASLHTCDEGLFWWITGPLDAFGGCSRGSLAEIWKRNRKCTHTAQHTGPHSSQTKDAPKDTPNREAACSLPASRSGETFQGQCSSPLAEGLLER